MRCVVYAPRYTSAVMRCRADALACFVVVALAAADASCDKKADTMAQPTPAGPSAVQVASAGQGVQVTVGEHGFAPSSIELPKGQAGSTAPVTFLRTTDETCAKEVVFPDVGIKKDLPLRKPVVVDVPADAPRKLTFQCGMAMYKGAVVVK